MKNKNSKIPKFVINWTDKFFHQSAFDIPLKFPNKKVIDFLATFKKEEKVKLYRGIHKYNEENYTGVESWTYDEKIAARYAKEIGGRVVKKIFNPKNILLDTTLLNEQEKVVLGYDYKIDDKEVLIKI